MKYAMRHDHMAARLDWLFDVSMTNIYFWLFKQNEEKKSAIDTSWFQSEQMNHPHFDGLISSESLNE